MTSTYKVEYILPGETEVTKATLENIRTDAIAKWEQVCDRHNVTIVSIEKVEAK